jgi:hypothetical protein
VYLQDNVGQIIFLFNLDLTALQYLPIRLKKNINMSAVRDLGHRGNGVDRVPRPFVIGVAGGTASGKVNVRSFVLNLRIELIKKQVF